MIKWLKRKSKNFIIKATNKFRALKKRRALKVRKFAVLSNNCWGGSAIYLPFGFKYNTPTIDLAIMDEDYMKFLSNLDHYLEADMKFINPKEGRYYEQRMTRSIEDIKYPVGKLDDIEIWFTHYATEREALKKWNNRKKKFLKHNRENILVKWSERFDKGEEHLRRFVELPFKHKVAFVTPALKRKFEDYEYVIAIPELKFLNMRGGDETDFILKRIDIVQLINSLK